MNPEDNPSDSLYLIRRARCGEMYGASEEEVEREMAVYRAERDAERAKAAADMTVDVVPILAGLIESNYAEFHAARQRWFDAGGTGSGPPSDSDTPHVVGGGT